MSNKSIATIATMGIDIGKNSFHVIGLDRRGAIVLRQKWSRGQIEALKVRKTSLQCPNDQTLFGRCEKFRRRAKELNRSRGRMLGRSRSRLIEVADGCVLS